MIQMHLNSKHVPSVRVVNGMTLYFETKNKVHAMDSQRGYVMAYRMDCAPKSYYAKSWKPFLEKLYRSNTISSVYDVAKIAQCFDVDIYCPWSKPPEIPQNILVRPSKFKGGPMGIFKPTKITGDVIVYSKYCIECEEPLELQMLKDWAQRQDLVIQIIRTAYKPADHKQAAEIYGNEDYPCFVVTDDVKTLKEFAHMISEQKNKLVKEGKTKDDVHSLSDLQKTHSKAKKVAGDQSTKTKDEKEV